MSFDTPLHEIKNIEFAIRELKKLLSPYFGTSMANSVPRYVWVWDTIEIVNITVYEWCVVLFYNHKVGCSRCSKGSIKGARIRLFATHTTYFKFNEMEIHNFILDDKWAPTIMD